ncbi:MAG TPA: hypothetical protein VFR07_00995 [Mycobacteriales bacterium]|jgi:hypothetical protein|nr:hypothetical protein [Mycobacteriales bacterium]
MLLPDGVYVPLLLSIEPSLTLPSGPGDYFGEEQIATWGVDSFRGLPEYPRTAYYRTFESAVSDAAHLYEFVVPMVPPAWSDVCQPAMASRSQDYYEHWGLTHFLLDGHHKVQAAAETRRPLQLLSLLSVEASLSTSAQIDRVPSLRAQPGAARRRQR